MKTHQAVLQYTSHHEITWCGYKRLWRNGTISGAGLCVSTFITALMGWQQWGTLWNVGKTTKGNHSAIDSLEKISEPSGTRCEKAYWSYPHGEWGPQAVTLHHALYSERRNIDIFRLADKVGSVQNRGTAQQVVPTNIHLEVKLGSHSPDWSQDFPCFLLWPSYCSPHLKECDSSM